MRLSPTELVEIRRDLHRNPELSHAEGRTAAAVVRTLTALGIEARAGVAGHGVIAVVEGDHPGPTLLFRADMDALPIQEEGDHDYVSENPGVMHACGHDVHTTIGLGVAASLVNRRADLRGRVKLVFQPAEEAAPGPGQVIGAEKMVEEGALSDPDVDAAFALHVMPNLDVGQLGYTGGTVWAASDLFDIEITGRMAHGAYPQDGADPLLAGAAIVQALQQVVSRNVDTRSPCVLSVCRFEGGNAYNVIPDRARLRGLLRTHDDAMRDLAMSRAREIVESTAQAHGCSARLSFVRGTHLTENRPGLEDFAGEVISSALPDVGFVLMPAQMGAEDFAAFSRRVPGCYLFLGVRNEARGIVHQIHTPRFDVDEACLAVGVDAMTELLLAACSDWESLSLRIGAAINPG